MLGRTKCQNRDCMDDRGLPIHDDGIEECRTCNAEHRVVIDADGGTTDVYVTLIQPEEDDHDDE